MTNKQHSPMGVVNVDMRDFTSRLSASERATVANVLNERGFPEVLHLIVNEGNADVFLFSVQQDSPMFTIGKGRGRFFLALLRNGEVLGAANDLAEVLANLPDPSPENSEDE